MYNFWETTLLGEPSYRGNPMVKHLQLNQQQPLEPAHFDRWLALWKQTINTHFAGPKAEEAITRAQQIAHLMQFKIEQSRAGS